MGGPSRNQQAVSARVPQKAARPELGKSRSPGGGLQEHQLVAGQGSGRLPHRRHHQHQEGASLP